LLVLLSLPHLPAPAGKPAIAQRLEAESAALAAKKAELTPEKLADDLAAADARRQKVLEGTYLKRSSTAGTADACRLDACFCVLL
jgi:UDP-N-acetylglucosamine:LPS N-acetylglucosamine transferase